VTRSRGLRLLPFLLLALPARAEEPMLPVAQQVPLLLKVLTYERTLMGSATSTLRVGFLYDPRAEESRRRFDEFEREFLPFADKTLKGHSVELVPVPFRPDLGAKASREAGRLDVVYVPPGDPAVLPAVRGWTRSEKILSATPVETFVQEGLSLGLVVRNGRTGVTINEAGSREEGRLWAEDFLRLCRVIRPQTAADGSQPAPG
jgi:hypothetical protein